MSFKKLFFLGLVVLNLSLKAENVERTLLVLHKKELGEIVFLANDGSSWIINEDEFPLFLMGDLKDDVEVKEVPKNTQEYNENIYSSDGEVLLKVINPALNKVLWYITLEKNLSFDDLIKGGVRNQKYTYIQTRAALRSLSNESCNIKGHEELCDCTAGCLTLAIEQDDEDLSDSYQGCERCSH
jgi:hypothetical protein